MTRTQTDRDDRQQDFAQLARTRRPGFFREFWDFLRANRKWWLLPVIVGLLLVGALIILSSSSAVPLIYTLF